MHTTMVADSAPHRTYVNREGNRELAKIAKANQKYEKK